MTNNWNFVQWNNAKQLNKLIGSEKNNASFVLLLKNTTQFDVENDIKSTLYLQKKSLNWFIEKFKQIGVVVEYATIFTNNEIKLLGPISSSVSDDICNLYIKTLYDPNRVRLVASFKTLGNFRIVTPADFTETLLTSDAAIQKTCIETLI
jgi:hypothetical protein